MVGGTPGGIATGGEHRHELLHEQRVAAGDLHDAGAGFLADLGQSLDQLSHLVFGQGLERDRLSAPAGALLHELRPCEAQKQHRRVARPVDEVLDQIEQRRLRPVDVLDDENERLLTGAPLERLPHRPEDLLGSSLGQHLGELLFGACFTEDLDERPVGDPLAVRKAAARERRCVVEPRDELPREPRLADARRPGRGDEAAATLADRPVEAPA
jgi:hypothetical protein